MRLLAVLYRRDNHLESDVLGPAGRRLFVWPDWRDETNTRWAAYIVEPDDAVDPPPDVPIDDDAPS